MLDRLERKLGKYAIPNLMSYIIGGYVVGYIMIFMSDASRMDVTALLTLEPFRIIHGLELWRIISWIIIPPSRGVFWAIIMCIFYWQLGTQLERMWGTFKFNVYIFGGIFFTVVGAFVYYGIMYALVGIEPTNMGAYFSTYYINMSIFLAFSLAIPDMAVMLYFCIPIKMKWLSILYAALIFFEFLSTTWAGRTAILCSLLNFIIFYVSQKGVWRISPSEMKRKKQFRDANRGYGPSWSERMGRAQSNQTSQSGQEFTRTAPKQISRHKCAVCGRTELTNPELEFRFCSKCNGNYEYCSDHLFTHTHVQ